MPEDKLQQAYELLSDPRRWTRKELARTRLGFRASPMDSDAKRFCAVGALLHVGASEVEIACVRYSAIKLFGEDIVAVNDRMGHEAVLLVLADARALARGGRRPATVERERERELVGV